MSFIASLLIAQAASTYFPPYDPQSAAHCSAAEQAGMARVGDFSSQRYGSQLAAAGEPSLYARSLRGRGDALRFTWLPAFDPAVFVRIERLRSKAPRLVAVRLTGAGSYSPGSVADRIDRRLSVDEAAALRQLVEENDLSAIPSVACGPGGTDGSRWLVERAIGTRFRLIDRWSPKRGKVHAIGMTLLGFTGWQFRKVY
jgi:hypothetical protein